ncbi:MAG: outer membrane lipoprotein carrier protein LolA [Bacteroidales bacterium]|nr:outer membrane lipoprotein carrier protein LolA [Bacteroidales bacterium]
MMKKTILFILSIIISFGVFSQSKKAEQIIEDITTKTQSYSSVEVQFTFTYEDPSSGEDVSEPGKLIISGDRYILDIEGQKVMCDGKTIWTYIEDAWEVQINSIEDDDDAITPSKLLTTYNDEYKAKLDKEFKQDGVNYQRIELKPEEGKKWVKLEVLVNADKQEIAEITIYDKNGGKMHYAIDKFTPEVPVSDDDFTFDPEKYPDVEVVDMR